MTTIATALPPASTPPSSKSASVRAADGDYKTKGVGHEVKDADGDYKPMAATSTAAPPAASATLAALASLKKGG